MVYEPNRPYVEDPDATRWAAHFEREGREVWEGRDSILAQAGLRTDMTVVDVGAGTGAFAGLMAQRVGPSGRVLAIEPMREFRDHIGSRQIANVSVVAGLAELSDAVADAAVCIDTLHHIEHPEQALAELLRVLRPGASLLLVDLIRERESPAWVREHVRLSQSEVEGELNRAGFVDIEPLGSMASNYLLRAGRP